MTIEKILPIKETALFYSEPGHGKSNAIKQCLIQALRENPNKLVKLVIGDGSASTYDSLVEKNKAEMCFFMQRPWPLDTLQKLTSGWWLKDPKDPLSDLIPPTSEMLYKFCGTAWEGASVMGRYLLGSVKGGLAQQAASGIQMGPDPVIKITMEERDLKGKVIDGPGTSFGTNGTAHYMAAQGHEIDFINSSLMLPGHHWWTAHETIVDDATNIGDLKNPVKVKKGGVIGVPEVAGKALGPVIQRAFNTTLHFQILNKQVQGTEIVEATGKKELENEIFYRFYTREHYPQMGATSVKYKACTRDVGSDFPAFYEGDRKIILNFYRDLREAKLKELHELEGI